MFLLFILLVTFHDVAGRRTMEETSEGLGGASLHRYDNLSRQTAQEDFNSSGTTLTPFRTITYTYTDAGDRLSAASDHPDIGNWAYDRHSRGAAIVIELARELQMAGVRCQGKTLKPRVNFLGLYDAVDRAMGYGQDAIPANVDRTAHALRDPRVESRTLFGNTGVQAEDPKSISRRYFFGTHAALGGDPWKGDKPKTTTPERDVEASIETDKWVREKASEAGIKLKDSP